MGHVNHCPELRLPTGDRLPVNSSDSSSLAIVPDSLQERDPDGLPRCFADGAQSLRLNRQFMIAIPQCHERALNLVTVHSRFDLHEPASAEKGCGFGPDDISPTPRLGALAYLCCK